MQAAQVCAYELGIPMDLIKVKASNSNATANSITTGGSITSENVCAVRSLLSQDLRLYFKHKGNTVQTCYHFDEVLFRN